MEIANKIINNHKNEKNNKYYENKDDFLITLKKKIELLCIDDQKDILRLMIKNNVNISENNNGSFINISSLKDNFLFELYNLVEIKVKQKELFENVENEKQRIKQKYMN